MRRFGWIAFAATLLATAVSAPCGAQPRETRMQVSVERREGEEWKRVDPSLVFANGEVVRFRFSSSFDGFLYVTDYGTTGRYALLFPRKETGQHNQVEANKEYLVPETSAVFRISGPPGYESVYFLVSPVALGTLDLSPPKPSNYRPPVLMPRCDDTAMRARGLCLDSQAGPRNIGAGDKLPSNLEPMRRATTRELTILQEDNQAVVSAPGPSAGPMLYEFRLAHK